MAQDGLSHRFRKGEWEKRERATHLDVFFRLFAGEGATVSEQIAEAYSNTSIHVENESILLGRSHFLHGESVIQKGGVRELLLRKRLDQLHTQIGVRLTLYLMPDPHDCHSASQEESDEVLQRI